MSDKLGAQNSKPETPRPARLADHQHATRLLALRTWLEKMQRTYLAEKRRSAADAARAARTCAEWAESVAYVHGRLCAAIAPPLTAGSDEADRIRSHLRMARQAGAPVVHANGRISDASLRGFLRWSPRGFRQRVFADASLYLMQSAEDARRAIDLGAPPERVQVTGNLKYDCEAPEENDLVRWLRSEVERTGRGPLLVAGSVLAGEERPVLDALALVTERWPGALLVLAPRKPERFAEAAALIEQAGRAAVRRSALTLGNGTPAGALRHDGGRRSPVLLVDTIGELASLYRLADAVFVGGSLVPSGGHNPLEPAAFGKAPVFGPSMEAFREVASEFLREGAALQVGSGAELGAAWISLLENDQRRTEMGARARAVVEHHRGATGATLNHLAALLSAQQAVR